MKQLHDLVQGTDAWAAFRLDHFGASEAAAMLGLSPNVKRNELLHAKHTGIAREFSEWLQTHVLDRGHQVEALARPLVEALIGDDLYAVTCSNGKLSASCDGLTMDERVAFEHKQWNEELAAAVQAGLVPDSHMPQCQQILMVTGAEKVVFVVSDGTPDRWCSVEVLPDPAWFERIRAGWTQFERDLAAYAPPADAAPTPSGKAPDTLPALRIEVTGMVTASNLAEFKQTALAAIRSVNRELSTDVDFANAESAVKWCSEVESRLAAAKEHALSQTSSIDALFKTIDDISAEARQVRLDLDKLVTARKTAVKSEIVQEGRAAYETHEAALRAECGAWKVLPTPDFAGSIKGLRTVDSIRNAVQTTLANAKIKADESARAIRAALAALDEESKGYEHLFADRPTFIGVTPEAVRLMARDRIAKHRDKLQQEADAAAETARERIRSEEREAAANIAQTLPVAAPQTTVTTTAARTGRPLYAPLRAAVKPPAQQANEPTRLKLGTICERLGFTLTAAFVSESLGIQHSATDKTAKLYRESDWARICAALIEHINVVSELQAA